LGLVDSSISYPVNLGALFVLVFIDGEQSKTPAMKLRNDEGCTATER
jgi:hypothetical protein